jgi:hypothetical protein
MIKRYVRGRVTEQHGEREDTLTLVIDFQPAQAEFRNYDRACLVIVECRADPVGNRGQSRRDLSQPRTQGGGIMWRR